MPYVHNQPTLVDYLYQRGVRNVTVHAGGSDPGVSFVDFPLISTYLYEMGALLGRARRDRIEDLNTLVAIPGKPHTTIAYGRDKATARLNEFGRQPSSFYIFIVSGELEKLGLSLKRATRVIARAAAETLPLDVAEPHMKAYALEGIGFGTCYPDLTKQMYSAEHITLDSPVWEEARQYGLPVPGKWAMIPFEDQEDVVLHKAAVYASRYYPELMERLDLQRWLQSMPAKRAQPH